MNDSHAVALIYSIEHDSTVKYEDSAPIERGKPEFSINGSKREMTQGLDTMGFLLMT